MTTELPKAYDPQAAQAKWLQFWTEHGFGQSRPDQARKPFTIVIPPPNVTGALHLGHALNNTLQDILIRWRRMQGYNALYLPGTDHAGIATQAMVERRIREDEGKTRHDLGREELVRRIWQWKDQYEKRILGQLRELGCSCDWTRTRFTLDPICARAVRHTFFKMFRDGLIFRGKRLVNWDAQLQTSVADDETYVEEIAGGFWTFKYPVKELPGEFIRFSTTRPETMLGDTAVCVHPGDERYRHLIGKVVTIPLVNRDIPIIADGLLADPTLGTGCVKVTPAHDPNDYACGLRHRLPMINILTPDGKINENGGKYRGMDRYQAREECVADMEKLGLFEGKEDRIIPLKYSDRSKTPIEPYLSDQWFVNMGDRTDGHAGLAQLAIDAVTSGRVQIFPERYARSYLDWLGEKRDWCISRQLWWGHRIPIWYTQCPEAELKRVFGDRADVCWRLDEENARWEICALEDLSADALGPKYPLTQDPDVLDTWFSSALWPHSTLGWPELTPELAYYYPTSVLVTSRDIITLWVARMVLTGLYNLGQVPFHHVYIHPKILDGFGETMSKTKGNGIDPLDIIAGYGTDALRFGMANVATENQDYKLPVANVCPHCTKLVAVKQEHLYMRTKKLTCPECKKPFRPGGPWPAPDPELPTARQASERFEMGRNFANKLWNAARFLLLNLDGYTPQSIRLEELPLEDRWILSRLATTTQTVTDQLEQYRFADANRTIYDFTWSEFCDWYVEMSKGRLKHPSPSTPVSGKPEAPASPPPQPSPTRGEGERSPPPQPSPQQGEGATDTPSPLVGEGWGGGDARARGESRPLAQRVLAGVLDSILRLAHPIMPFVTESIWQALNEAAFERGLPSPDPAAESVMIAAWPEFPPEWRDPAMEQRIGRMQELVRSVREARNRYLLNERQPLDVFVRCSETIASDFQALGSFITLLAGVGKLETGPGVKKPQQAASHVTPDFEMYVSLVGLIDVAAEIKRLEKQLAEKKKFLSSTEAKLANPNFRSKAAPEVVQQQLDQVGELQKQIATMEGNLAELRAS